MSRSVDLFLSCPEPLETVATTIGEVAEVSVEPGPDGVWTVHEGDTSVTLSLHRFVDDGDLFLSRYPYVLSGAVPATARPQDTPVAALLRHVGSDLQQRKSWQVLLVLDLQYREPLSDSGATSPRASDGSTR